MGKDSDLLQVVKDQDVGALHRMLVKNRGSKTSKYFISFVCVYVCVAAFVLNSTFDSCDVR